MKPSRAAPTSAADITISTQTAGSVEISVRGQKVRVPSAQVGNRTLVIRGRWLKIASIHDEESIDGEVIANPETFVRTAARLDGVPDIFTFAQRIPDTAPKYSYPFEWDNAAAVAITSYQAWLREQTDENVRRNIKKAAKLGVVARVAAPDDEFIRGIVDIYNETPFRQGRPFWHYGKDFNTVKAECTHCVAKSEFIGAYYRDQMVGFIKLLRVGLRNEVALILAKQSHFDKRPTTALLAKAVEVCEQRDVRYLAYGKLAYGRKANASLAEFKRRHGFEQINFPRYYVPLTRIGRAAVKLKLYRELTEMLPERVLNIVLEMRAKLYS